MATGALIENRRRRSIGARFRLVWVSVIISSTGDGVFVTALPLLAATLTGDPVLIAGITIATRLPWLVLSMFTGAIADRMDRRRLMIFADLARFVVVGLLGVSVLADTADIWQLYVCAFLRGAGETRHVNAAQAILPDLVEPDDLMQANARFGSAQIASAQFAGPPFGVALFHASLTVAGRAQPTGCLDCHANTRPVAPVVSATMTFDHSTALGECSTCHTSTSTWVGGKFHTATAPPPATCLPCHAADRPTTTTGWMGMFLTSPFDYVTNANGITH
ncbi:MAG: MFS transporter, partial [Ilumatobacteraceae bacterium]